MTIDGSILQYWRDKVAEESHYTNYKAVPSRYQDKINVSVIQRLASQAVEDYKDKLKAEFERLKKEAPSLRDAIYLNGVLAVIDSIK